MAILAFSSVTLYANERQAEEVTTVVTLDKTLAKIADPFNVTIRVSAPSGTQVSFPHVGDQLGELEIIETRDEFDIPNLDDSTQRTWTRMFRVESLLTGELTIPPQEIQVGSGSEARIVRTEQKTIRIASVLENQTDPLKIRDIKSERDLEIPPTKSYAWLGWLAGGCGLTVVLGFFAGVLVRRKKWITPKQWAIRELDTLRHPEALGAGDANRVLAGIETTTKIYLETQFAVAATSSTSDELLAELTSRSFDPVICTRLGVLLSTIEHAKYAGRNLDTAALTTAVNEAQALIESLDAVATQSANATHDLHSPPLTNVEVN